MDNEEAALLHEEATMTIEELLVRYGQNLNKMGKKAPQEAHKEPADSKSPDPEKVINGEIECTSLKSDSNGSEKADETEKAAVFSKIRACRKVAAYADGNSGCGASSKGEEPAATGDAGPSCSSSAAPAPGSAKSKFFEDSEESEDGEEEEEGSDKVRKRNDLSQNKLHSKQQSVNDCLNKFIVFVLIHYIKRLLLARLIAVKYENYIHR